MLKVFDIEVLNEFEGKKANNAPDSSCGEEEGVGGECTVGGLDR